MKAEELRIGNLINTLVGKIIGQKDMVVVEVNHIKHIYDGNEYGYTPIPLTEEWLKRFGCIKQTDYVWITPSVNGNITYIRKTESGTFFCSINEFRVVKLPYVHILQNFMYFIQEQTELTYANN